MNDLTRYNMHAGQRGWLRGFALLAMVSAVGPALAAPITAVVNGSFEETAGVDKLDPYAIHNAAGWTDLTVGIPIQAGSTTAGGPKGNYDRIAADQVTGSRYMRLVSDGLTNYGGVAQNLGTMEAGKTYTLMADVLVGNEPGITPGRWSASLQSDIAAAPTVYATATSGALAAGAYSPAGLTVSYTATAADAGKPLWLKYGVVPHAAVAHRGGIDNVRLSDEVPASPPAAAASQLTQSAPAAGQPAAAPDPLAKGVQAGFYTPGRTGGIWDNWACYHEGKFYLYYVAGPPGKDDPRIPPGYLKDWNSFGLATSDDGVHWKEYGTIAKCREKTTMGSGHIWKSPNFAKDGTWIMNYSEFFGEGEDYWSHVPNFCGQNIIFLTSTDLLHWSKVDESLRFNVDVRWFDEKGRWDCMDVLPRADGSLYAYFTACPTPGKVAYKTCWAVGCAESKDGLKWQVLPPIAGDTAGEVGGIEMIGQKYYLTIGPGLIHRAERPEGPFLAQQKNPNLLGNDGDVYFSRFFHSAPGGPLVNHFYTNGTAYAAPFKAIEIDPEGTMRLKWWPGNDTLKEREVALALATNASDAAFVRLLEPAFNLEATYVVEGSLTLPENEDPSGFFFDGGGGTGQAVLFTRQGTRFGPARLDGVDPNTLPLLNRDLEFGPEVKVRLVMRKDMLETYMNDHLMTLKRVNWNGRMGVIGQTGHKNVRDLKVWTQQ
ncbi:MAG: hypothetical protein NTW21_00755 [Verrucomicrobia bacterium]|nr:hypothetical protein [Verrucomicrobiota bacterium]